MSKNILCPSVVLQLFSQFCRGGYYVNNNMVHTLYKDIVYTFCLGSLCKAYKYRKVKFYLQQRTEFSRLKNSRNALHINVLPFAHYFRQRFAPVIRHRRRSQGYQSYHVCTRCEHKKSRYKCIGSECQKINDNRLKLFVNSDNCA